MKCEEFDAIGLDAERDASLGELERAAAREHACVCSRCAALQDSWESVRVELHAFADSTVAAETPKRVEMRLRREFRTQHGWVKTRRAAVIAAWALAAAGVLAGAVSWGNWRKSQQEEVARHLAVPRNSIVVPAQNDGATPGDANVKNDANGRQPDSANPDPGGTLVADNELGNFTPLLGALPAETDEAAIVHVRMQRGSLGTLGLPVNEERAGEWIQVDLLVGDDGLPQAVRLPQQ